MTKMFTYNGMRMNVWNLFTGCWYSCYGEKGCWAKIFITTRLKNTPKYKDCGFSPTVHMKEFGKKFKENSWCFVSSMGDLSFAPNFVYAEIFEAVTKYPKTNFLMCTKNPTFYESHFIPQPNLYFGATIETNRDTSKYSKAPPTEYRYNVMQKLEGNKFLSIEPIMDFDVYEFTKMVIDINPKIVEIGADNYNANLTEPSGIKVKNLINSMEANGIEVIRKQGLDRLFKGEK